MEKALGRDIPSAAEIRRRQQQGEQVRSLKDAAIETPSQTLVEASVPALNAMDDGVNTAVINAANTAFFITNLSHLAQVYLSDIFGAIKIAEVA